MGALAGSAPIWPPPLRPPFRLIMENKRIVYGRRQGHKLHKRQAALVDTLLPDLWPDLKAAQIPRGWFSHAFDGYALEIGFGGGEHLAARAKAAPHIGFIGCEPFLNGVAKLLREVDENRLSNIAVYNDDARDVMAALPAGALMQAYLLYPDPWPKTRHHKRRFISTENIEALFRILKPQALFMVASDIPDYLDWTLAHIKAHGGFDWQAEKAADWRAAPEGWPGTRYEAKAIREGRVPGYLQFRRRAEKRPGFL